MSNKHHTTLSLRLAGKFHEVVKPDVRAQEDEFFARTLLLRQYEAVLVAFQQAVEHGDHQQVGWHLRSLSRMSAGLVRSTDANHVLVPVACPFCAA